MLFKQLIRKKICSQLNSSLNAFRATNPLQAFDFTITKGKSHLVSITDAFSLPPSHALQQALADAADCSLLHV